MDRLVISALIAALLSIGGPGAASAGEFGVQLEFSNAEIAAIRAYYRDQGAARPGKKDAKPLPPGIVKNLRRGQPLPPGIARQTLPEPLIGVLPKVTPGFERVVVDGKILLVEVATRMIHDVLDDAILD